MGARTKDVADTRWVLTWKEVEGTKTAEARSAAKGYRDPDLEDGNVGISGCVSTSSSHLQLISLGAPKQLEDLGRGYQKGLSLSGRVWP